MFLFPLWLLLFRFPLLDPLTAWDSVPGHFPRAVTLASAGADLKEREQMSEAEVGLFVQRLRGLMTEIGEGSEVGRGGHSGVLLIPASPNLPYSKDRMVSVVSSVERGFSQGEGAGIRNSTRRRVS